MASDRLGALAIFGATSGWGLPEFRNYATDSLRLNHIDPGSDPSNRMLDLLRYDGYHEVAGVASFFPSSGAVNPSLTAIANALRVGDHLLERLR